MMSDLQFKEKKKKSTHSRTLHTGRGAQQSPDSSEVPLKVPCLGKVG